MTVEEAINVPKDKFVLLLNEEKLKEDNKTARFIYDIVDKRFLEPNESKKVKANMEVLADGVYTGNSAILLGTAGEICDELEETGLDKYVEGFYEHLWKPEHIEKWL